MVVVESGLANGRDFWVLGKHAKRGKKVLDFILNVRRMHADNRENIGILFRQGDRSFTAFDPSSNCNNPCHASGHRTFDHFVKVISKIGVVQMSVGIDQHSLSFLIIV